MGASMEKLEKDFKTFVEDLQKKYQDASDKKDKDDEAIKSSGLGLLKAVHAHEKGLGPACGPANLDLCDDEEKKQIEEFRALGAYKREEKIKEGEASVDQLKKDFNTFVEDLKKKYQDASDKKEKDVEAIKSSEERIREGEASVNQLIKDFNTFAEDLQKKYQDASDKKDKDVEAIKSSGLGLLKAVHAHEKKSRKIRVVRMIYSSVL